MTPRGGQPRRHPLQLLVALARRKGDCFVYSLGQQRSFFVNRPEWVRHVLVDRARDYSKDTPINEAFTLVAKGLLTSEGEQWRQERSLMQPAFARRNVPAFAAVVNQMVGQVIARWEAVARSGEELDLTAETGELLFRITAVALFHVDPATWDDSPTAAIAEALPVIDRPEHPANPAGRAAIAEMADRIVNEREARGEAIDDVLATLMTVDSPAIDAAALRGQVATLALAGYETTASVVAWACYLLAQRRDLTAVLRRQIASVVGDGPWTLDHLAELPYLTAVIKETLRLYPPAWIIGRRALRPDRIGDAEVPAGSVVAISPYVLHRHPDHWTEPETFDPERFMNGAAEHKRHPFSYIPFGAGPRTCIGVNFALAEAPLIVGQLIQRFDLTLAGDGDAQPLGLFVLQPREPIRIRLSAA